VSGLRVRDLAVARGGVVVLEGVSFDVAPGSALILRGPNGIGKTTLLRTLAGLQPPVSGRIEGAGAAAYAGHADGVKAALSVAENLSFWARLHGVEVPDAVLARFGLTGLGQRLAGTLSAGQARRLGLARVAVVGGGVALLDEPTVSLDTGSVARFARWLTDVHLAGGGIAVIASHVDPGIAAPTLDLGGYRAGAGAVAASDGAFL